MVRLGGHAVFAETGAADNIVENAWHPFMHRTDLVDYAIVLTGEIYMLLDNADVHLKAGDLVVQRGTNYAWSNRGSKTCIDAFVLVGAVTSRTPEPCQNKGPPVKTLPGNGLL